MTRDKNEIRGDKDELLAELARAGIRPTRGNAIKCPFHDDKHASATIHLDRDGAWRLHCHASCKKHWDVFDVRAALRGTNVKDELREATGSRGKGQPAARPAKVYPTLEDMAESLARHAGGEVEHIYRYKATDNRQMKMAVVRIKTPTGKTFRQGHPAQGGWVATAPKPAPLFMLSDIATADAVMVVEGEKAAAAVWGAMIDPRLGLPPMPDGHKWAVTTSPMGAGNGHHADWTPLSGKKLVVLWEDFDKADPKTGKRNGEAHMRAVAELLQKLPVPPKEIRRIDPNKLGYVAPGEEPDGEDAVEYIERFAGGSTIDIRDMLYAAIVAAKPLDASGDLKDLLEDTINGKNRNLDFGPHKQLTRMVRALHPETCTVIAGGEGSGKSLFMMDLIAFWTAAGIKVSCLMLEKRRAFHLHRALAQLDGKPDLLDHNWLEEHPDEVRAMYARHREALNRIAPAIETPEPGAEVTYAYIMKWLNARADAGAEILIVDPITKVLKLDQRTNLEDDRFMLSVEALLQRTRCRLLLITHTVKGGKVGGKQATGSDAVAGGAAFGRFCDSMLLFSVNDAPRSVKVVGPLGTYQYRSRRFLKALKSRNGPGDKAEFAMFLDPTSLRFQEQGLVVRSKNQTPEGVVDKSEEGAEEGTDITVLPNTDPDPTEIDPASFFQKSGM